MGRPAIEIDLQEVERLAGLGLTQEEIALNLGVSQDTITRRKKTNADFAEAIKRGRAKAGESVASELFKKCKAGDLGAIIWYEKTRRGLSEKMQHEHSGQIDVRSLSDDELRAILET